MSHTYDPEKLRRLEQAFRKLPKLQREVFLARRLDGLSYGEIAYLTGLAVPYVERQMAKAIYKLAKQMDGQPLRWWERWF